MKTTKIAKLFLFTLILATGYFNSGCSSRDADGNQNVTNTAGQIAIPEAIKAAALPPNATIVVNVYMDGSTTPAADEQIFTPLPLTGPVEFTLHNVSAATHSFTVVFTYTDDPDFPGTFELANATISGVSVGKDTTTNVNFTNDMYTYADDDGDGISNLDELDQANRTDPTAAPVPELTADALSRVVTLTWSDTGASSYNLYTSTAPGCDISDYAACPGGTMTANITSPYTVTALTNGTPYYFQLEAEYSAGGQAVSTEVGARPNTLVFGTGPSISPNSAIVMATTVDSSGNSYVGGSFTRVGAATGGAVPLDAASGRPNSADFPIVSGLVYAVESDGSGGWYIGGEFTSVGGVARNNLAHILADGTVDPNWAFDVDGYVRTFAISGSTVFIGGFFSMIDGQVRNRLAAVDVDGNLLAWNPDADGDVWSLVVSDTTVYASGSFSTVGGLTRNNLAAINAISGAVLDWDPGPDSIVYDLAISPAGDAVYVAGSFSTLKAGTITQNNTAAIATDTTGTILPWNPDPDSFVITVAVSDTAVYLGGAFTSFAGATARNHLAAVAPDGTVLDWDPNVEGFYVISLELANDIVYAGGSFSAVGGQPRNSLAAVGTDGVVLDWSPNADDWVWSLAVSGETVYAGGFFSSLGGQSRNNLAAVDSDGALLDWNPDADRMVNTLAISGTTIYAGGEFTSIGGQSRQRFAAIGTGGVLLPWNPNGSGTVNTLAVSGSTIYAGGSFDTLEGGLTIRNRLAAIASDGTILAWNPDANGTVNTIAVSGSTIYVGGSFTALEAGVTLRNRLAAISDTGVVQPWNPDANGTVNTLAVSGATIYAGGSFTALEAGVTLRNRLAAISDTGGVQLWDPNADSTVYSLAVLDSTVYAGGAFTTLAGTVRNRLAAIASDGTLLSWNPSVEGNTALTFPIVRSLTVSGTTVYVGGSFNNIGGQLRSNFARIGTDGSLLP